ncbi:glutamate receptor ionotropic, kainate 2-like [Atheta coriaria]|uniref:glutamate receptor ionotropic, kainate 2-like n=1 Tax=Dalotia coriaria TaxID=877792 RepID=UPI0031F344AD
MNQTVTYTSLEHQCTHKRQIVFKPGTNLKVLGFELAPYFTLVQPPDLTIPNGHVSGLEVELLNLLTVDWPVEIEVRPMYSWDEILADLENHKADVGLSAIWQSRILSNDLDFLHPYMGVTSTFLVPDAMLLPKETYVFQSLSIGVWLIIFVAIILISQVIKYIAKWHERRPVDNYLMMALSYYAINSTTSQAHSKFFHAVVLMWSFASLLLNTSYSAGFTSIENVPPTTKPINTFQDAIDRQLRCYSLGDFSQGLLRASMEPDKMKFADMMIILETTPPVGVCTGVDLLLNSYVFAGYKLTNTDLVTLKLLLDNIQSTYNVFAVARNSPYFRDLDTRMIMLKEYGFVSGMLKKYSGDQSLQDLKDFNRNLFSDRDYTAKEFKEVQGVFYLLMIGSTLALFCFIGEWVKARYTNGEILRTS